MSRFHPFYEKVYGERWPGLLEALLKCDTKVERECFGGYSRYVLDSASIRAAEALRVRPGDRVLDLCAAPGGKSLILAEALSGKGSLIANELSSARRLRLKEVLDGHVPPGARALIEVTGFDGNQFGLKRPDHFDRVLLDAPCSSERHLLQEDPEQKDWKESRTKQLAMRQYSLLCSALLALKPGGTLVYSTCSLSPLENDGVVERLLERKEGLVKVDEDSSDLQGLSRTRLGYEIFPDRASGAGPIYFSRLIKTQSKTAHP
jgi:16S rRNA C967 or C1407 C5-methylase (RsmB/RsmF family)